MIIDQSQNCLEYDNSCCSWMLVGKSFRLNFAFLILEMQVHFGLDYISCFSAMRCAKFISFIFQSDVLCVKIRINHHSQINHSLLCTSDFLISMLVL
jgi:hypothetical protein